MGKTFEELEVWGRSKTLAVRVYKTTSGCRDYGFRDQITRAALSIPSNIAEGAERTTRKEFAQFVGYAKGSAGELRTQLLIGSELGFIAPDEADQMINEASHISKMLFGLLHSLTD